MQPKFLIIFCLFLGINIRLAAQETGNTPTLEMQCKDVVYTKNGDIFRGKILEMRPDTAIFFQSWNGLHFWIAQKNIKKIKQECASPTIKTPRGERVYSFQENGLYESFRVGAMLGTSAYNTSTIGYMAQFSVGWKFNHLLGVGLGAGFEHFNHKDSEDAPTYPIFAEVRGYLLPKKVTPYYNVGFGYAFADGVRASDSWNRTITDVNGGAMGQASLGARFGNHFTFDIGVRFQKKTRVWESNPNGWGTPFTGVDNIMNKRLVVTAGLLF